jgi:twitching motility protein PilT
MDFDFAEAMLETMRRGASDLHLTAGSPPMVRVRGRLNALEEAPKLSPQMVREVVYSILTDEQRKRLENDWQIDFAYSLPGAARFRVNAYFQRASLGAAFRLTPSTYRPSCATSLGSPADSSSSPGRPDRGRARPSRP